MAVTVMVRLECRPGAEQELLEIVEALGAETRRAPGAGPFELLRDLDAPGTVIMVERWEDRGQHEAYAANRVATNTGVERLAAVLGARPQITYHETVGRW